MLDINTLLDIKYYDGVDFADMKMSLGSPGRDTETVTFNTGHYLYIGYYKPVKFLYFDFAIPNTNANSLTIEYSNSSNTWTELNALDETAGFTRNGLLQWEEIDGDLLGTATIDSTEKYWVRIKPSAIHSESEWNFSGLILSSDEDLLVENPYILDTNLLMGERNHLKAHVASRKEIIQTFSNKGAKKNNGKLTFWDMLDIQEFRQGSIFLTLSKIYFNLSDKDDDTWLKKSEKYRGRYQNQVNLYYKTLDTNDTGLTGASELSVRAATKTISR